jgi:hypothetical protein
MSAATAALVGAGAATIGSALISSNAAGKAADKQAQGTSDAIAENRRQFDINQANQAPYLEAGKTALGQFAAENDAPLDVSNLQMEPGYQFGLQQGQQAIDRRTAAAGGRISGAALKAAAQYGTDYATTGYSAAYGRANQARTDRLNRLAALAGIGQTATQSVGAQGANTAGANSALMVAAGNNAGAATLAQGNIWGNAGNQLLALYGRNKPNSFTANADGTGASPYEGYDAAAAGGWGIE